MAIDNLDETLDNALRRGIGGVLLVVGVLWPCVVLAAVFLAWRAGVVPRLPWHSVMLAFGPCAVVPTAYLWRWGTQMRVAGRYVEDPRTVTAPVVLLRSFADDTSDASTEMRIPAQTGQAFRLNPARHSGGIRPPILGESGHPFRRNPAKGTVVLVR